MAVDLTERVNFFENYIVQTRNSIRLAWVLAFAVFTSGVVCAILINVVFGPLNSTSIVGTIGSGLVTLLSAAPLKDYFSQRSKITTFQYIKSRYSKLSEDPNGNDDPEIEKLESIFYDLLKGPIGA